MPDQNPITMISPAGSDARQIPTEQVESARGAGWEPATKMYDGSNESNRRWIPESQREAAQSAGWHPAEEQQERHNLTQPEMVRGGDGSVKEIRATHGIGDYLHGLEGSARQFAEEHHGDLLMSPITGSLRLINSLGESGKTGISGEHNPDMMPTIPGAKMSTAHQEFPSPAARSVLGGTAEALQIPSMLVAPETSAAERGAVEYSDLPYSTGGPSRGFTGGSAYSQFHEIPQRPVSVEPVPDAMGTTEPLTDWVPYKDLTPNGKKNLVGRVGRSLALDASPDSTRKVQNLVRLRGKDLARVSNDLSIPHPDGEGVEWSSKDFRRKGGLPSDTAQIALDHIQHKVSAENFMDTVNRIIHGEEGSMKVPGTGGDSEKPATQHQPKVDDVDRHRGIGQASDPGHIHELFPQGMPDTPSSRAMRFSFLTDEEIRNVADQLGLKKGWTKADVLRALQDTSFAEFSKALNKLPEREKVEFLWRTPDEAWESATTDKRPFSSDRETQLRRMGQPSNDWKTKDLVDWANFRRVAKASDKATAMTRPSWTGADFTGLNREANISRLQLFHQQLNSPGGIFSSEGVPLPRIWGNVSINVPLDQLKQTIGDLYEKEDPAAFVKVARELDPSHIWHPYDFELPSQSLLHSNPDEWAERVRAAHENRKQVLNLLVKKKYGSAPQPGAAFLTPSGQTAAETAVRQRISNLSDNPNAVLLLHEAAKALGTFPDVLREHFLEDNPAALSEIERLSAKKPNPLVVRRITMLLEVGPAKAAKIVAGEELPPPADWVRNRMRGK